MREREEGDPRTEVPCSALGGAEKSCGTHAPQAVALWTGKCNFVEVELVFSDCRNRLLHMKNDVVPVQIRGILPANSGCALFVGNDDKVFVINVEPNMGAIIGMFLRDTPKERPLTHDLIQSIFKGFSINVERVVITELRDSTYFARLILQQQNELARKIVEIDARPSDCLALATAQKRPIYVAAPLFEQVEDMSEVLNRINETGSNEPE